jgi:OHCU decarboxylase
MSLTHLNQLPVPEAERLLLSCCGSRVWAERTAAGRPYRDVDALLAAADEAWRGLPEADRREAFAAHPRIGERGKGHSEREQSGARGAAAVMLTELAERNQAYEARFGHVFLICASGKGAGEMLDALRARFDNPPEVELEVASEEQRKITRLRLERVAMEGR